MRKKSGKTITLITVIVCSLIGISGLIVNLTRNNMTETGDIYVLSSTDNFPIEAKIRGRWEGIIPQFFEEIEKQTGLKIAYIEDNGKREELISNQQIDIIGAITTKEGENLAEHYGITLSEPLFSYQGLEYHIGYSATLPQQTKQDIEDVLNNFDEFSRLELVLDYVELDHESIPPYIYILIAIAFFLIVMTLISNSTTKRDLGIVEKELREGVVLGGIKNLAYFEKTLQEAKEISLKHLQYVAILNFDNTNVSWFYGEKEAEKLLGLVFNVVTTNLNKDEFSARLSENDLLIRFFSKSEHEAKEKIEILTNKIRTWLAYKHKSLSLPITSGVCKLDLIEDDTKNVVRILRYTVDTAKKENKSLLLCDKEMIENLYEITTLGRELIEQTNFSDFTIHVMPTIDANTKKIMGAQALARWEHPTKGLLQPQLFLSQFETSGKVIELNYRIFDHVCEKLANVEKDKVKGLSFSCSMSLLNLQDSNFKIRIYESLSKYKVPKDLLNIIIKSKSIKQQNSTIINNLKFLETSGIKITIANFGDNSTNIAMFSQLKIESVTLNPVFLDIASTDSGKKFVDTIMTALHALDIKIIASKIETKEQEIISEKIGVDNLSGYKYYKPMPFEEFVKQIS